MKSLRGAVGNIILSTFAHQRFFGSVDDGLTLGDLQIRASVCPRSDAICLDAAGWVISSANVFIWSHSKCGDKDLDRQRVIDHIAAEIWIVRVWLDA
jgi:hypothetical protein